MLFLKAFQSLLEDGHSGMSIGFTKQILNRLIDGKPLTPIEDTPDAWEDGRYSQKEGYTSHQCKRMSSLFKYIYLDGTIKYTDIDRFYCFNKDDPDSYGWYNSSIIRFLDELFPITMP